MHARILVSLCSTVSTCTAPALPPWPPWPSCCLSKPRGRAWSWFSAGSPAGSVLVQCWFNAGSMLDHGFEPASNIKACSPLPRPWCTSWCTRHLLLLCYLELVRMQPQHLNLELEALRHAASTVLHLLGIHHRIQDAGCWMSWRAAADAPLARSCELPLAWKPLPSQV